MIGSWVTGIVGILFLSAIWIGVQSAWRRAFSDFDAFPATSDPDVLARRRGCGGCSGFKQCERRCSQTEDAGSIEESDHE